MPVLREYRVPMPVTMEEFERARQWHKVEQIKLETHLMHDTKLKVTEFGERMLLRENTNELPPFLGALPINLQGRDVEHCLKGYGLASLATKPVGIPFLAKVGSFFDIMISSALRLTEVESWDCFPYFRSISTNSSLGPSYRMLIEGVTLPGNHTGAAANPMSLTKDLEESRKVFIVDIADNISADDYRDGKDPVLFRSQKTGRGRLQPGTWMTDGSHPVVTTVILIDIQFDFLGPLGHIAELFLQAGIHRAMRLHHRELFCYIDEWIDLPLRTLENTARNLQLELEELVESKLGESGGPVTPREALRFKDEEMKPSPKPEKKAPSGDKLDEVAAGETEATKCCPLTNIKTIVTEAVSPSRCGGSLVYSWMVMGLMVSFISILIALIMYGLPEWTAEHFDNFK